jgi:serine/threonine protein kinase
MSAPRHLRGRLTGLSGLSGSPGAVWASLRRHLWAWPVIASVVFGGVGWWVQRRVEATMREEIAGQLDTILDADVTALRTWGRDQRAIARSLARLPALRPPVRGLLAAGPPQTRAGKLPLSQDLAACRAALRPQLEVFDYTHFYIVSPEMRIVAADEDALPRTFETDFGRSFLRQVLRDGAALSRPHRAAALLPDAGGALVAGLPSMLVAAAITDGAGKPLAVLALRLRPEKEFSEILQTARFGESGETYAFSETGLLLSQSRFDQDLKRLGLLPDLPDAHSILTAEVRDPGVNMMEGRRPARGRAEQPLTKLAEKAVTGGGGVVMDPYGDYRGVPSVGACRWLPEYGFGIATEVDVDDVFQPLSVLRRAIWSLLGLLLLSAAGMFAFTAVIARQQRRMEKAESAVRQLGQYTLEEKIGAGGMGAVYRARHAFLKRRTAVKLLDGSKVTPASLARFEREVQLTSQLCHPNTIAVYDYGRTADGVFYYAMEYLDGLDLDVLVKAYGPLPEARVVPILRQMCGSLAEAHELGLIHRDVKPANVILTSRAGMADFVKVLDFGLVKATDSAESARLTQANVAVGTPHYMSPEAVETPDQVTAQSDIYAIGAVAYYLVTGRQVFTGATVFEVCIRHVHAIPEPPSARGGRGVSPGLDGLILRCLAKKPGDRPAGARALAAELDLLELGGSWTPADADGWWRSFQQPPKGQGEKTEDGWWRSFEHPPQGQGEKTTAAVDRAVETSRATDGGGPPRYAKPDRTEPPGR